LFGLKSLIYSYFAELCVTYATAGHVLVLAILKVVLLLSLAVPQTCSSTTSCVALPRQQLTLQQERKQSNLPSASCPVTCLDRYSVLGLRLWLMSLPATPATPCSFVSLHKYVPLYKHQPTCSEAWVWPWYCEQQTFLARVSPHECRSCCIAHLLCCAAWH
jgi:hypothetical protein